MPSYKHVAATALLSIVIATSTSTFAAPIPNNDDNNTEFTGFPKLDPLGSPQPLIQSKPRPIMKQLPLGMRNVQDELGFSFEKNSGGLIKSGIIDIYSEEELPSEFGDVFSFGNDKVVVEEEEDELDPYALFLALKMGRGGKLDSALVTKSDENERDDARAFKSWIETRSRDPRSKRRKVTKTDLEKYFTEWKEEKEEENKIRPVDAPLIIEAKNVNVEGGKTAYVTRSRSGRGRVANSRFTDYEMGGVEKEDVEMATEEEVMDATRPRVGRGRRGNGRVKDVGMDIDVVEEEGDMMNVDTLKVAPPTNPTPERVIPRVRARKTHMPWVNTV